MLNSHWIIWKNDEKLEKMQNSHWISWKIAPKASNMPSQDCGNSPLCPTGHRPFGTAAQKGSWSKSSIQPNWLSFLKMESYFLSKNLPPNSASSFKWNELFYSHEASDRLQCLLNDWKCFLILKISLFIKISNIFEQIARLAEKYRHIAFLWVVKAWEKMS